MLVAEKYTKMYDDIISKHREKQLSDFTKNHNFFSKGIMDLSSLYDTHLNFRGSSLLKPEDRILKNIRDDNIKCVLLVEEVEKPLNIFTEYTLINMFEIFVDENEYIFEALTKDFNVKRTIERNLYSRTPFVIKYL